MATLVFTAMGSLIGGTAAGAVGASIGAGIGAMVGQSVDSMIFRPGVRHGPRLSDLQVQTSRYGAPIPRIYGALRVAGTVIWATDLQEGSSTSGGKGRPNVTTYSYSVSFAVALSSRAVLRVGRIWADGNLLRGAAGDFKSPLGAFRFYRGGADQAVDPLIASAVGAGRAPAYRDCAYAVFEGLQLADFGNRIPSLTFEIFADTGSPGLAAIAADMAGRPVGYAGDDEEAGLYGFAAHGALGDATSALAGLHDLQWRERDGMLALASGRWSERTLDAARMVRSIDGNQEAAPSKARIPIEGVPVRLSIRHHDPARDYQLGLQTAYRPGPGVGAEEVDLPAAMSADGARQLADRKLRAELRRRRTIRMAADWTALDLAAGDVIALSDEPGRWLVTACDWDDMAVRLSLRAFEEGARLAAAAGESGTAVQQPDLVQGVTSLAIVELPGNGASTPGAPQVFVAASGATAGWRRAALFRYQSELEAAEPLGPSAPRAVIGAAVTVLGEGAAWRLDLRNSVEVVLANADDVLTSVGDDALPSGANLCQIGDEVLQFADAEPLGEGRYRLSRLIRGWHGTEWASDGHSAGEAFVLLDAARLVALEMSPADVGNVVSVRAVGSGDTVPAEASRSIDGRAMMPLSPVHGHVKRLAGGDFLLGWTRRSRLGFGWVDGADAPLGEEREGYVVTVTANEVVVRQWEVVLPCAIYSAADRGADVAAAGPGTWRVEIRQQGSWGLSRPLAMALAP